MDDVKEKEKRKWEREGKIKETGRDEGMKKTEREKEMKRRWKKQKDIHIFS